MAQKPANKSFVLRIDAATMSQIEAWAEDEFRSINGQLQWIIADALRRHRRLPKGKAVPPPPSEAADSLEPTAVTKSD